MSNNQPNGEAVRNHSQLISGSDGTNGVPVSVDSTGKQNVIVSSTTLGGATNSPSNVTTTAYDDAGVVKASAGTLYGFSGYNSKASAQFILFYDSASVPADTAQAVLVLTVPATSNFSYSPGQFGRRFSTGIAWSNSSTAPTKTVGSADVFIDVQYS